MWSGGREVSAEVVGRIQATVEAEPGISRGELSRRVCAWEGKRAANGRLQEVGCRKALAALERRGVLRLPEVRGPFSFQRRRARETVAGEEVARLTGELEQVGEVAIVLVSSRYSKASKVWHSLMERYHYLGGGPLCGAQLRYLVGSTEHGWLGGLSFSAAGWRLKARDEWIGWSDAARWAHLPLVVCNSRFLIVPTVRVPNLASHVLSRCTARLCEDWAARYGYAPVLLETFVDRRRFRGTCYRAANWVRVGQTVARGTPYANGKRAEGAKDIYVYPTARDWQQVLCAEPVVALGRRRAGAGAADWREEEFGGVELFDQRLKRRLLGLAEDFFGQPGALVPQACGGSPARAKAAYRFFANPRVRMKRLLRGHVEATIARIRGQSVVLAVQDTTTLNYSAHPPAGCGPINTRQDRAVGLILHDTMAFTPDGTPLGLLDVQCWARDAEEAGKRYRRKELPIEQKESLKWLTSYRAVSEVQRICPNTMVVSVGDREADVYELFEEAARTAGGAKLLIRAERARKRQVGGAYLWERMGREQVSGVQSVRVPRRGSRRARTAQLQVRFARVELQPPQHKELRPVAVWAVSAREVGHGPEVKEPIDWMLLSTVETSSFGQACERLAWYSRRWGIEVYHRTVKSGCRIEDRRLADTESLMSCLAIDLVVAWRVYWVTKAGRETPTIPCDKFLHEQEWQVLCAWATRKPPPALPPPAEQAAKWIGKLGGWLGRKGDGPPGATCIWRGLVRLQDMAHGYALALTIHPIRAGPGPPGVTCG